jgi:hypothetical protein
MSGYTFDASEQCVEKQNNVYFTLKELDTDEKRAIIKSSYDYRYYLVSYNTGCYSSSFRRYLNQQIVVNLGTDFDLDRWDKIVLQDDNEVCDIASREKVDSYTTLNPEEAEDELIFIPSPISASPQPQIRNTPTQIVPSVQAKVTTPPASLDFEVQDSEILPLVSKKILNSPASFRRCPSTQCSLIRYYAEGSELNIIGKYKDGDWYQVDGTTDAGGTGRAVHGWIYQSLFSELPAKKVVNNDVSVSGKLEATSSEVNDALFSEHQLQEVESIKPGIWRKVIGWFKFWD